MPQIEDFWRESSRNLGGVGEYKHPGHEKHMERLFDPTWPRCKEEVIDKKTKKKRQCQNPAEARSDYCRFHGDPELPFEEE